MIIVLSYNKLHSSCVLDSIPLNSEWYLFWPINKSFKQTADGKTWNIQMHVRLTVHICAHSMMWLSIHRISNSSGRSQRMEKHWSVVAHISDHCLPSFQLEPLGDLSNPVNFLIFPFKTYETSVFKHTTSNLCLHPPPPSTSVCLSERIIEQLRASCVLWRVGNEWQHAASSVSIQQFTIKLCLFYSADILILIIICYATVFGSFRGQLSPVCYIKSGIEPKSWQISARTEAKTPGLHGITSWAKAPRAGRHGVRQQRPQIPAARGRGGVLLCFYYKDAVDMGRRFVYLPTASSTAARTRSSPSGRGSRIPLHLSPPAARAARRPPAGARRVAYRLAAAARVCACVRGGER